MAQGIQESLSSWSPLFNRRIYDVIKHRERISALSLFLSAKEIK